ncbi:MbtH family protein [Asaia lannensis]|uniref:MbtH family protein n=1 Tax=Asaia lannensis NBRC 102526 TaxID=1307926 RepID=A0ABT1CL64_9PROT|nr:MbtH family protein [Asaia lannensis]MCO6161004.1 MbtH family protein [Asaia lannensis NBRC 102526]GBQ95577.1 MbtH domain-containing protein [Asaia lannensis NBRC 102526]
MSDEYINPFDDERLSFHVLRNDAGYYSLWPSIAAIPAGWAEQYGPDSRQSCLSFIEDNWSDAPGRRTPRAQNTIGSTPVPGTSA